jgi:hypothetical protein
MGRREVTVERTCSPFSLAQIEDRGVGSDFASCESSCQIARQLPAARACSSSFQHGDGQRNADFSFERHCDAPFGGFACLSIFDTQTPE